jgi:Phosphotransferase enzyme family
VGVPLPDGDGLLLSVTPSCPGLPLTREVFAALEHAPGRVTPVLLHADLKPAHVMYDAAAHRIGGALDWGDVSLGDPDFDLAEMAMVFGERFLLRLLPHLPDRDPAVVLAKAEFFTTVRWIGAPYSPGGICPSNRHSAARPSHPTCRQWPPHRWNAPVPAR